MSRSSNGVFKSDTPHFFKVIILRNDFIDNNILRIPSFAREHGISLSDRVCLEVPGGSTWDVGHQRDDQGILLLRDGWAEFMRHYHIDHGHFTVFRYEGDSRFHIIILDRTTCEIEYTVPVVEISQDECIRSAVSGKRKSRPPKKSTRDETREMNDVDNEFGSISAGHLNFNAHHINYPAVKAARDSGALQRASSFKCQNPSSLVVIQPMYVHPRYRLYLSRKFLTACIPNIEDSFYMKLCTSGKKAWTVRCSLRNHRGRPMFSRGWRKLMVDNNLRVGHVCVFEFLGRADAMFRVTIFRAKGGCMTPALVRNAKWHNSCESWRSGFWMIEELKTMLEKSKNNKEGKCTDCSFRKHCWKPQPKKRIL